MEPVDVGLLVCGHFAPDLEARFGGYPALFETLLSGHGIKLTTYDADQGELPTSPSDRSAWLITGSADSVYDDLDWIGDLSRFTVDAVSADRPVVGVCFGHQILGQALGGRVAKSPAGWGLGLQHYRLDQAVPEPGYAEGLALLASHQDQVVELPPGAELALHSDHCPIAGFTIGDRVLAIQPHPEFTSELTIDLLETRRARLGDDAVDAALAEDLSTADPRGVAAWIARTLAAS